MKSSNPFKIASLVLFLFLGNIYGEDEVQEVVVISSKYPVPLQEVVGSVDSISLENLETRMVSDHWSVSFKT